MPHVPYSAPPVQWKWGLGYVMKIYCTYVIGWNLTMQMHRYKHIYSLNLRFFENGK